MINLFFTCLACFLSFLPYASQAANLDVVDDSEYVVDDVQSQSKPINYLYEGSNSDYIYYVYSTTDIEFQNSFFDICNYISSYNVSYVINDDNNFMPINTRYTVPIKPCYLGNINSFNVNADYPFDMTALNTFNWVSIIKHDAVVGGTALYSINFWQNYNSVINDGLRFFYAKVYGFDYILNCSAKYAGSTLDPGPYCVYGDNGGEYNYLSIYDILTSISSKNINNSYYQDGYNVGYDYGYNTGYQFGYGQGYTEASDIDATASTIFTGILDVALIPVNVFLTIFNFEVFGINIAGIVSALLTISVVVIIIRFVTGKKDD